MCKVVLFGGTTEGRLLANYLGKNKIETLLCVATDYGSSLVEESEFIRVSKERLDVGQMIKMLEVEKPELVIDSTHPYADVVTTNIKKACQEGDFTYIRLIRDGQACHSDGVYVDSVEEAVSWLADKKGRVFVATGSKELEKYTELENYKDRVVARVLSTPEVAEQCSKLGFIGKNLICMQGPFSREMNEAILRQYDCKYMVTKISGKAGGYEDKIVAAVACGCTPIIVGRPSSEVGMDFYQCKSLVRKEFGIEYIPKVTLVGIGMGTENGLTKEASCAIEEADVCIGARRMLDLPLVDGKPTFIEYKSDMILDYIKAHDEYESFVVLLSGDTGFYSGAKKLTDKLKNGNFQIKLVAGVSSLSYFMSKCGLSWDDAVAVSNHGLTSSLIPLIRDNEKVFSILGKTDDVAILASKLLTYGLEDCQVYVGENLSYENEKFFFGKPEDFVSYINDPLAVVCVVNSRFRETALNKLTSRPDEEFIRGKVPMTKSEIRRISIDKLALTEDAVCYDVGAGTGSISIEMAIKASWGRVFAIEKKPEAVELIKENKLRFMSDNLSIVEGFAPEALVDLPAPTHVFIGGSSGNMEQIVSQILDKADGVKFVINCIALESVATAVEISKKYSQFVPDIVQISVSSGRQVGSYTMMSGENPITIVTFTGQRKSK